MSNNPQGIMKSILLDKIYLHFMDKFALLRIFQNNKAVSSSKATKSGSP